MENKKKYNKKTYNNVLAQRFQDLRIDKELTDELQLTKKTDNKALTQEKLAELLGVGVKLIQDMENCRRGISKRTAKNMAELFHYSNVDYLLDENVKHKSKYDEMQTSWRRINRENLLINEIVTSLAELNGYTVEIKQIPESGNVNDVLQIIKSFMVFKKNDKIEFSLSVSDVNIFGNYLSDVFESNIKWYFKK